MICMVKHRRALFWVPSTWALRAMDKPNLFNTVWFHFKIQKFWLNQNANSEKYVTILLQIIVVETKDANSREQVESRVEFSPHAYHTSWEVNRKKPCSCIATYKSNWRVPLFQQHHTFLPASPSVLHIINVEICLFNAGLVRIRFWYLLLVVIVTFTILNVSVHKRTRVT